MNPKGAQQDFLKADQEALDHYSQGRLEAHEAETALIEREPQLTDFLLGLWRERRFIAKAFFIGLLVAAGISLIIPPEYESTTRLMPPEKQGLGGIAAMLAATGEDKGGSLVGGLVSDALGMKSTGALFIGVLKSETVQNRIVDQFDLRKVYHVHYQQDARERLSNNSEIIEDRKSGIIAITVTDRSPQRAMQIARAYPDTLGRLTATLDTSAAHKERVFLEDRLKQVKVDLDAAADDLSKFSSKNLTLDVKEQGKAMMEGAAALEGELIAAESQLSGLEQIYTPNNMRVKAMQGRVDEMKRKLAELKGNQNGADDPQGASPDGGDFGISIAKLPSLGVTYYDLYRRVKIQEAVFEILTKQCELAKIQEAKEVPSIKVLDEAQVPEIKSSPKRTLLTIFGAFLATMFATAFVLVGVYKGGHTVSGPVSLAGLELREGLESDWALVQRYIPASIKRLGSKFYHTSDPGESSTGDSEPKDPV